LKVLVALALCAAALAAHAQDSARETATRIVRSLAAGDIESAAALSNAPQRRREVLEDYRSRVGADEFKRVYAQYLASPIVDEIAIGAHHLVIWDLGGNLAGQFYVAAEGRFLLDDVPGETRTRLRRILDERRQARASGRRD
jgi:hypothetical protein